MIIEKAMAIGAHAWFFFNGKDYTLPEAGTASVSALPDAEDTGWVKLNDVESWELAVSDEKKEIFAPSPGVLVRSGILRLKQSLNYKFTTNQMSALALGIAFRASEELDAASYQFVPLSGVPPLGWLKLQKYDHDNEMVFAADIWGELNVAGGLKGSASDIIMPEFEFAMLYSSLNTMAGTPDA